MADGKNSRVHFPKSLSNAISGHGVFPKNIYFEGLQANNYTCSWKQYLPASGRTTSFRSIALPRIHSDHNPHPTQTRLHLSLLWNWRTGGAHVINFDT